MYLLSVCAAIIACLQFAAGQGQLGFNCNGLADGDYSDMKSACSQWYWTCKNGAATQKFCNDGLAFYAPNDTCIDSKAMPACGVHNEADNFDCSQKADGSYPNNATLCSQISGYSCKSGVKMVHWCWATARFDIKTQHCLFPKHMSACGGTDVILSSDTLPAPIVPPHLNFDCLKKTGDFPDPDKACSNLFVICGAGGFPSAGICPAGTVYDVSNDWCQYPQYVLACGGHPSTVPASTTTILPATTTTIAAAVTTTTMAPATTTMAPATTTMAAATTILPGASQPQQQQNFSCDGLDIGYYANPQQPCSQTYFACTGSKWGILEQCAPGTFWDRVLLECNWHDSIPECGGTRPTTVSSAPISTVPGSTISTVAGSTTSGLPRGARQAGSSVAPITFNCTGLKLGNYPIPEEPCSRFFYTCTVSGMVYQQTCPINTWYDKDLDQCNFYAQIPACSGTPRPNTTMAPTTTPGSTVAGATPIPFNCMGKQDRNYLPVGVNCSDFFWECSNGNAFKQNCPPGLKYDEYADQCLDETDVYGCPKYIPRSMFCASKPVSGVYAYPGQCASYVFCDGGLESVLTCPNGTMWNSAKNRCDQPSIVPPPCGTGPNPAPLTCANQTTGVHGSKDDCSIYINCAASGTTVSRCPEGTAFDHKSGQCYPAYNVPKCFPPAQDGLAKFCADIPDGIYAFPGNCRRGLFCLAKKAYVMYCTDPATPYWDPLANKCSMPTSTCTSTSSL